MYVTKHLSCAISVTNALINLAFVAGAKRGGRGGRTPATQATINSEMMDALEEIALLFVSSRNAPPHKEELCVTTSVEAGCGRCPDMQHILSGTWDQGKKTRWRPKFAMFIEILDFMVNPPVVFNFNNMA